MAQGGYRPPPPPFIGGRQPHEPRRLPPSQLAVQADNPPPRRSPAALFAVLAAWAAPAVMPLQPRPEVVTAAVVAGNCVYPAVLGTATNFDTAGATNHTVNLPPGIGNGARLISFFTAGTPGYPANWVQIVADTGGPGGAAHYYECDGTEGASITVTTGTSVRCSSAVYLLQAGTFDPLVVPQGAINPNDTTAGSDANPDPPSLTPSWGAVESLWFAAATISAATIDTTAWPANYSDSQTEANATGGTNRGVAVGCRNLTAVSDNPGTFTTSGVVAWKGLTVAVKGLCGVAPVPRTSAPWWVGRVASADYAVPRRLLSPALFGAAADNPPVRARQPQSYAPPVWWPAQSRLALVQEAVTFVPFTPSPWWLERGRQAEYQITRRLLAPSLIAVAEDNPPFPGTFERYWDAKPVSWPTQSAPRTQPPPPAQVDAPPPSRYAAFWTILVAWRPLPPQPPVSGKLNPSALAVAVDNPPFNQRPWNWELPAAWPVTTWAAQSALQLTPPDGPLAPDIPPVVDDHHGKGGWDPHHYKQRKKRKEPIRSFLDKIENAPIEQAPEDVQAKAEAARIAAEKFLADQTEALRERALQRIEEFYALISAEIARLQAEDEDDWDWLLLTS